MVRAGYRFSSFLEGTGANLRLPLNPPFFIESNVNYDARTPGDIRTGFSDVIGAGDLTGPRTGSAPFYPESSGTSQPDALWRSII